MRHHHTTEEGGCVCSQGCLTKGWTHWGVLMTAVISEGNKTALMGDLSITELVRRVFLCKL